MRAICGTRWRSSEQNNASELEPFAQAAEFDHSPRINLLTLRLGPERFRLKRYPSIGKYLPGNPTVVCPQCHVSNPPGATSCGKCSTPFGLDIATLHGPVEDFVSQVTSEDDGGVGQVATVWSQFPEQFGPEN